MKQQLEIRATVWLQNAYKKAEELKHEQILPLHLYYSILDDADFFASFWVAHPQAKVDYENSLAKKLKSLYCGLDQDEHPVMSEALAGIISFTKAMRHSEQAPLSAEILFKVLITECPLFGVKEQKLLQNLATEKIHDLYDKSSDVAYLQNIFSHDFFLNFKPSENLTTVSIKQAPESLGEKAGAKILSLNDTLNATIYGQKHATAKIADTLSLSAAGFKRENKTAGTFILRGPTGSGKTEMARGIARELDIPLIKFDMSEFTEPHSPAKLIGTPPGYVSHGEGGLLVKKIKAEPCCVLLLDEYEKAHRNIDNLLLQIMDDGLLTDGRGVKANFSNVILIMTSNAGQSEAVRETAGFGDQSQNKQDNVDDAVKLMFSPEFRNRLDGDIVFNDVKHTVMPQIVAKFIRELQTELEEKNLSAQFTEAAEAHLAFLGRKSDFGARDVKRLIESKIKVPVALAFLAGKLRDIDHVTIDFNQISGLKIHLEPTPCFETPHFMQQPLTASPQI